MPYKVQKKGAKHCVVKEGGEQVACHDTRGAALKQVRALYANEKADLASERIGCVEECERAFLTFEQMASHLDVVHGDETAREFKPKERKKLAKEGKATSGGGFPIRNEQDLRNAIRAYGRAGNKAQAKAHIIKRAKALKLTNLLPKGWRAQDIAGYFTCPECEELDIASARSFGDEDALLEHAEAVHTFSDIDEMLRDAVREKYYVEGDYKANPPKPTTWAWVRDMSVDWVVFEVEKGRDQKMFKASYSITDGNVTLGEPTEVIRKTVYEPVKKQED